MGNIPTIITIASRGAAQWLRVCLVAGLAAYLFSNSSGALADAEHLTIQEMPIDLGTSGASVEDLYVNACCTAGTLARLTRLCDRSRGSADGEFRGHDTHAERLGDAPVFV